MKRLIEFGLLACAAASAAAHPPPPHQKQPAIENATRLNRDQFVWQPEAASTGPLLLVIDLTKQNLRVFRGGIPIAASTISSGRQGRETPVGDFTILQKEIVYRSRTYDDAPMPYMQRITPQGVAMHAGNLPGYPASHGCIRLPRAFAELLYGITEVGTQVIVTDAEQQRIAADYQSARQEFARKSAELHADAERALDESDKAMAAHEQILRQHNAEMARYRAEVASK